MHVHGAETMAVIVFHRSSRSDVLELRAHAHVTPAIGGHVHVLFWFRGTPQGQADRPLDGHLGTLLR